MLYNADCLTIMQQMVHNNDKVDCIITDPPYLYINHKLDKAFDERKFFELASKITDKIVFFGRGDSFYRWNLLCAEYGFEFKEEIIWDKKNISSPVNPIGRLHETISVRFKRGYKLNKVKIDPLRKAINEESFELLITDLKRLISSIRNSDKIKNYLEKGEYLLKASARKFKITHTMDKNSDRALHTLRKYEQGAMLCSIIREYREHYQMRHPTQKPVKLLRKLVLLATNEGDVVFDAFMGSGSTGVACKLENRKFIGCEIEADYFEIAKSRLD